MNKNIIAIAIASLGFVIGLGILGNAIKNRNKSENTISVTGLGTKKFTSDLITWNGSFSRNDFELKTAYDELLNDRKVIENYLISKGIPKNELVFSAVDIQKQFNYVSDSNGSSHQTFAGYQLTQSISLESKDVAKIENLSRNITEIINLGIVFTSSKPNYFYTKLAEVKQEMIANATKEDLAEAARILAMQAAHYARKHGEMQMPDLGRLLSMVTADDECVALLRDGTEALVGVLGMVTGGELTETDKPMQ